jgi:hypothetical protein
MALVLVSNLTGVLQPDNLLVAAWLRVMVLGALVLAGMTFAFSAQQHRICLAN